MSHWNHRIMRRTYPNTDEVSYGIYEVYYNDEGEIVNWSMEPEEIQGGTIEEIIQSLNWMRNCLNKLILDYILGTEINEKP